MLKKIFAVFLTILTVFISVSSVGFAQAEYTADISFSLKENGGGEVPEIIYVYPGESVTAFLNLKTSDGFFAGPFASQIFYSANGFEKADITLNTSGRFYSCCKTYTNLSPFNNISQSAKDRLYPAEWNDEQKQKYEFFNLNMIPTAADCTSAPGDLDENLLTLDLTFSKKLSVGSRYEVFIAENSLRTEKNPTGGTYLSCYKNSGDLSGERYDYGDDITVNVNKAKLCFEITNVGDVNSDGRISAADALTVLQFSAGLVSLNEDAKEKSDVNRDGRINAADALSILQISAGLTRINDLLNK